jgi:hypothetical protein
MPDETHGADGSVGHHHKLFDNATHHTHGSPQLVDLGHHHQEHHDRPRLHPAASFVMGNHLMAPAEKAQHDAEGSTMPAAGSKRDRSQYALYIFAPDSAVRLVMWRIRASVYFQILILVATLACSVWVCLKPIPTNWALYAADYVFAVIFTLDISSGVIAAGFFAFWQYDIFNKIDLVTTVMYLVDLGLRALGFTYSLRAVRLFRIFKPMLRLESFAGIRVRSRYCSCTLKMLNLTAHFAAWQAIFLSLVKGASSLGAIILVLGLSLLVFVVQGVEFYMGSARRRCVWADSLQEVRPLSFCKRYESEHVSSCGLVQMCVDAPSPKSSPSGLTSQSYDHAWSAAVPFLEKSTRARAHTHAHTA